MMENEFDDSVDFGDAIVRDSAREVINSSFVQVFVIKSRVVQHVALQVVWCGPALRLKLFKKLHGGKNVDALTTLHRNYFSCKQG